MRTFYSAFFRSINERYKELLRLIISTVSKYVAEMRTKLNAKFRLHGTSDMSETLQIMKRQRYNLAFIDL